jgi:hypothetical protein
MRTHAEQVRLLVEWHAKPTEELLRRLSLTVNAIAMGQTSISFHQNIFT